MGKSFNEIANSILLEAAPPPRMGGKEPKPGSLLPDQQPKGPNGDIPPEEVGQNVPEPEADAKPEISDDNLDYFAGLLRDALKFDPNTLNPNDKAVFAMKINAQNAPTVIQQISKIIGQG